jgi:hypothetical protein
MGFGEVFWHVGGLLAVPMLAGVLAAAAAKLLWRRTLAAVPLRSLALRAALAAALAQTAGLVALGGDGRMLTYGAVVVAVAAALWWGSWRGKAAGG